MILLVAPKTAALPLVLHGASGIPADEQVKGASMNVGKANFNTELRTNNPGEGG